MKWLGSVGNRLMDSFALAAPSCAVKMAGHVLFWPIVTVQYGMFRAGWLDWYSEVYSRGGGRVLLGALPWPASTREHLLRTEKVTALLNLVSEHKVPFESIKTRLDVPMTDFAHPTIEDVEPAVEFIERSVSSGETVYVNCRAGKGRSATVVMCYLIRYAGMTPESAQRLLLAKRPQVLDNLDSREVVKEYYNAHRN